MRVLVIGGDGYLGWPTAMHFSTRGHEVAVFDSGVKRRWEARLGVRPLAPVASLQQRVATWRAVSGRSIEVFAGDVGDAGDIRAALLEFAPDTLVHYGEQPSAPFSMIDAAHAIETQANNVLGTLQLVFAMRDLTPDAHLIKLGTMGEYGTPNIDIEEGYLDIRHNGRRDRLPFPKSPGSFYHLSKVHDSNNLMLATRLWGLRVTDLNQGVVYGTDTDETRLAPELATSFHYDGWFGTVINRFVAQAIAGVPLTVYGAGGQRRAFLNIRDTLQCVGLAADNPAVPGEVRVFNQFTECFTVAEIADLVAAAARASGLAVSRQTVPNPRVESAEHYYNPKNSALLALGLAPRRLTEDVLAGMLAWGARHAARIDPRVIQPTVDWRLGGEVAGATAGGAVAGAVAGATASGRVGAATGGLAGAVAGAVAGSAAGGLAGAVAGATAGGRVSAAASEHAAGVGAGRAGAAAGGRVGAATGGRAARVGGGRAVGLTAGLGGPLATEPASSIADGMAGGLAAAPAGSLAGGPPPAERPAGLASAGSR